MPKLTRHQVGQAGEHFVAAELHRRGANAVTFSGNMPEIDVFAADVKRSRTVAIQVKTKTTGTWHTSINRGQSRGPESADDRFWVLVDIGRDPSVSPTYFVVPEWWIHNHIYDRHAEHLARHGGYRPRNPDATHFGIQPVEVEEWRDRWDVLGITAAMGDVARVAIRVDDGGEYFLGQVHEVGEALSELSDLARGGSGGGRWSGLLGDFVRFVREDRLFNRSYVDHLAREAADLLDVAGSDLAPPTVHVLDRIAGILSSTEPTS